jgi:peptidoglycan/xylan/chitin deacetylase (PgdA/CDA1 family)
MKIALTFDDGPNPFWTDKILNILDAYGVKATFFIIGKWAEEYPEIVADIVNRGHTVGNHGYYHTKHEQGFEKTSDILFEITGQYPKFLRPPYLSSIDNIEIEDNYIIVGGQAINDLVARGAKDIVDTVVDKLADKIILIMHDGSEVEAEMADRPEVLFEALPDIIDKIQDNGYEIVSLEELLDENTLKPC